MIDRMRKVFNHLALAALVLSLLMSCGRNGGDSSPSVTAAADSNSEYTDAYTSLEDFAGKRIGVTTGTIQGPAVEREIPTAEISYYNSIPDLLTAARQGKIDGFSSADQIIRYLMIENDDLTYLDEPLSEPTDSGAIFPKTEKGAALRDEFNEYLAEARASGVMEELDKIWFGRDESLKTVLDSSALSGENGTLVLATDASMAPASYVKDNQIVGQDIDNVLRFCQARGYGLKIVNTGFGSLLDAVVTGKCDFAVGGIGITEERAQSVYFSDPIFSGYSVIAYLKADIAPAQAGGGFLSSVADSFGKTFFRESRWKLFLEGIGTTLLITVLSILFGTALGFVVFLLCRRGNPFANTVTRFFVWLINGMPVVVLLMILYYIIFGKVSISGTAVSIIGFTLVFGAAVYSMVRGGVATVDRGQTEAAYALGYTDRRAFFRVVLPQALPHIMPTYKSQITALIKATAIVGYVAVQDLTKMGDIVRSRTYEAFFPLIAVAVIYFILAAILTFIVDRLEIRIDPRRRQSLLKGVRTDV